MLIVEVSTGFMGRSFHIVTITNFPPVVTRQAFRLMHNSNIKETLSSIGDSSSLPRLIPHEP